MWLVTLGGLALFLLGLQRIVAGMQALAGARMRRAMEGATRSPWRALATGTGVGAASQSGTATAISALSLVASGIMAVREGIAYSFGAQIGATLAIQLAAFRISAYALPMVGVGYLLGRLPRGRVAGDLLLGAGLLFLGLGLIVDAMGGMLQSEGFALALAAVDRSPLTLAVIGFVLGTFLTSSNATTALALGLYAAGGLGLPAAAAFVAGGNAGATVIAIVAGRELGIAAVRVAAMHTLVKMAGALAIALFAEPFAHAVRTLGGDDARQVANAHTLFNLAVALPGTLLAGATAALGTRLLPSRQEETGPRYLDAAALTHAPMALALARREIVRISDEALAMAETTARHLRFAIGESAAVSAREERVDGLVRAVVAYLADVRREHGPDPQSERLLALVTELQTAARLIPRIQGRERRLREAGVEYSRAGRGELADGCDALVERMRAAFTALAVGDEGLARKTIDGRPGFEERIGALRLAHLARLEARLPATRLSHTHHLEVLALLRQIDASLTRIGGYLLAERRDRGAGAGG